MKQYIVDSFTDKIFSGNPAAVCILDKWLDYTLMLSIAKENNLSETAFAVKNNDGTYHLRWFTPAEEIDLCGHATLATAFVISNFYEQNLETIKFNTLSGELIVKKNNDLFEMTFPSYQLEKVDVTKEMIEVLGCDIEEAYLGRDLLLIVDNENTVKNLSPNQEKLKNLPGLLQHVSAKGSDFDCVSRSFAPKLSIAEDPVCGSGHCHIVPYWANKLEKNDILAYQASERSGILTCKYQGDTTLLSGSAVLFSTSELNIK
ncbi:MAG: PhzF family phenazine biosynthesis protein [Gemella sp.]|nr:PhzF family phenazine biosynthesis protein [Gemella sp.]